MTNSTKLDFHLELTFILFQDNIVDTILNEYSKLKQ
jgi:hypothetical protein